MAKRWANARQVSQTRVSAHKPEHSVNLCVLSKKSTGQISTVEGGSLLYHEIVEEGIEASPDLTPMQLSGQLRRIQEKARLKPEIAAYLQVPQALHPIPYDREREKVRVRGGGREAYACVRGRERGIHTLCARTHTHIHTHTYTHTHTQKLRTTPRPNHG